LLFDFIRITYVSTTERLSLFLARYQIIYDFLWILFKLNIFAYTKYFGTNQLRYVRYEFREEKTAQDKVEYFYIKACYLDFDRKVFGETSSKYTIKKFRGAKQIIALEIFPLKYYPSEKYIRA
jgi:hypothetical protein